MRDAERLALARTARTDELLDAKLFRPLASYVVRAVRPTRVTPNHLTCLCLLSGLLAGWCIAHGTVEMLWTGAAMLLASLVLDCSDGQLARERGGGSTAGRILDGIADYVVAFSVHLGVLLLLLDRGVAFRGRDLGGTGLFFFVLAAGASMALQSALFDFYKHRYLFCTGRDYRRDAETAAALRAELARTESPVDRFLISVFVPYLRLQEWFACRGGARAPIVRPDAATAERYAAANAPILRAWSLVGPTGHLVLIALAVALTPPWPAAIPAYCVFTIVVQNAYALVLLAVQQHVNRSEADLQQEAS